MSEQGRGGEPEGDYPRMEDLVGALMLAMTSSPERGSTEEVLTASTQTQIGAATGSVKQPTRDHAPQRYGQITSPPARSPVAGAARERSSSSGDSGGSQGDCKSQDGQRRKKPDLKKTPTKPTASAQNDGTDEVAAVKAPPLMLDFEEQRVNSFLQSAAKGGEAAAQARAAEGDVAAPAAAQGGEDAAAGVDVAAPAAAQGGEADAAQGGEDAAAGVDVAAPAAAQGGEADAAGVDVAAPAAPSQELGGEAAAAAAAPAEPNSPDLESAENKVCGFGTQGPTARQAWIMSEFRRRYIEAPKYAGITHPKRWALCLQEHPLWYLEMRLAGPDGSFGLPVSHYRVARYSPARLGEGGLWTKIQSVNDDKSDDCERFKGGVQT